MLTLFRFLWFTRVRHQMLSLKTHKNASVSGGSSGSSGKCKAAFVIVVCGQGAAVVRYILTLHYAP